MKHELLAPAGSPETLKAVIEAGADAVYLGGGHYGARAYAQNFTDEEILEALDYAHLRGRKIFLTVNTLLKNRENGQALYDYLLPFYRAGLDAVIVQDYGVLDYIHRHFPDLPIHASTQMSVANVYGAEYLKKSGVCRIIPARELSLPEIRAIHEEARIQLECFVHGALCFCYSGQCLMSSLIGGRSGNRGRCAQPCRYPYQVTDQNGKALYPGDKFPLSLKDLCTLPILPKLCEAGIYSFKIEGRMKSTEYAAGVTEIYRKYVDRYEADPEHYEVDPDDYNRLLDLGNRNGFTEGYYEQRNGRSMVTLSKSYHTGVGTKEKYILSPAQILPVSGRIRLHIEKPMALTLECRNPFQIPDQEGNVPDAPAEPVSVTVYGETVLPAEKHPVSAEEAAARIEKCGNTPYFFTSLQTDVEDSCFAPVGQLNELRRKGLSELEAALLKPCRRESGEIPAGEEPVFQAEKPSERSEPFLNVQVSSMEQFHEALRRPCVSRISLDLAGDILSEYRSSGKNSGGLESFFASRLEDCRKQIRRANKSSGFCFPPVFRANSSSCYGRKEMAEVLRRFDCVWVRNYDSLGFALDVLELPPEKIHLDNNLYVYSSEACGAFSRQRLRTYTVSPELNQGELRHMPNARAEMTIYGRTPMMVTAQCLLKNADACEKEKPCGEPLYLRDKKSKRLFVQRNCLDCCNVIYNSVPLYLLHQSDAIRSLRFGSLRISFVTETRSQARKILDDYEAAFLRNEKISPPEGDSGFTTGHFRRGVE